MQRGAALILAGLMLAGCETVTTPADGTVVEIRPELPAGYPPKIGAVRADLNGKGQTWDVYDYSIGAQDAAAQIMKYGGPIQFRLMGQPAGDPVVQRNRLALKGSMAGKLATGPLNDALIEVIAGEGWDGLRLSSSGQPVELVLDEVTDKNTDGYGHARGHFRTVLCAATGQPIKVDIQRCQPFSGTFDTDLQFSNL
jgi:hypothetical protein